MDAVGPISVALETARTQLAACASYRTFLGAANAEAAIAKTHLAALPAPSDGAEYTRAEWEESHRPFGMVYTSTAGGYSISRAATYTSRDSGRLFIELEITIPTAYQPDLEVDPIDLTTDLETADRWILNQLGPIVTEFMDLSGQPGYLDVSNLTVTMGPSRERPEEAVANGHFYWTLLEVAWGATE